MQFYTFVCSNWLSITNLLCLCEVRHFGILKKLILSCLAYIQFSHFCLYEHLDICFLVRSYTVSHFVYIYFLIYSWPYFMSFSTFFVHILNFHDGAKNSKHKYKWIEIQP